MNQWTNPWTEPVIELLKQLAAEKLSASVIAEKINAEFRSSLPWNLTRNAIIGKFHRLEIGLKSQREYHTKPRPYEPQKRLERPGGNAPIKKVGNWINFADAQPRPPRAFVPKTVAEDLQIPEEQRRSILELDNHTCRFPIGEVGSPSFFYCGAEPLAGGVYCEGHAERAFSIPVGRMRNKAA